MFRKHVGIGLALLVLLGAAVGLSAVRSDPVTTPKQDKAGKQPAQKAVGPPAAHRPPLSKEPRPREIISLLRGDLDLTAIAANKLKLRDVVEFLSGQLKDRAGKEVLLLIDIHAFKAENPEITTEAVLDQDVEFPAFPQKMAIGTALRIALSKIPTNNATYLIRPGVVEITTIEAARPEGLLLKKVAASFDTRPLEDALRELSDLTGASIVLDGRAAEKAKTPVTATFLHDITLAGALRTLTDMADLGVVLLEDAIYVTTPENAARLHKEKKRPLVRPRPPMQKAAEGA
jgi:hypothetical protein